MSDLQEHRRFAYHVTGDVESNVGGDRPDKQLAEREGAALLSAFSMRRAQLLAEGAAVVVVVEVVVASFRAGRFCAPGEV